MIQRIQTLYLFAVSIIMGMMFFFPIAGYYGELNTLKFTLLSVENMVPDSALVFSSFTTYPLLVLVIGVIIIAIAIIFQYKSRLKQLMWIKINILINTILIMGIFIIYSRWLQSTSGATESYQTAAFFPLISMVFLVLSYRAIRKDEKLVRSADRLR